MENISITPENAQRTMWNIIWGIFLIIGILLSSVLLILGEKPIAYWSGLAWLLIMLPIFIYLPALYKSLIYSVEIDSIKMNMGVFWKKQVTVPYTKITNLDVTQGPMERYFQVGTLHVQTAGAGGSQGAQAELKLIGIKDTNQLKQNIMDRVSGTLKTKSEQPESEVVQDTDSDVLTQILTELKSIHKELSKRSS